MSKKVRLHFPTLILAAAIFAGTGMSEVISSQASADAAPAVRTIDIVVDGGYRPARIELREGERVRLRFVRNEYTPCTREIVFPSLGIRKELPTGVPVVIDLPVLTQGEYRFDCGMGMIHAILIVTAA